MKALARCALAGAIMLGATACSQDPTGSTAFNQNASLEGAFTSSIFGFDNLHSSFGGGDSLNVWGPEGRGGRGPGGPIGPGGPGRPGGPGFGGRGHEGERGGPEFGLGGGFMGGGLGGLFMGDGFGPGFGHGRGDSTLLASCAFDASSGRLTCPAFTHDGVTINRSASFAATNGTVQSGFDSATTNTITIRETVAGSRTRRDSAVSVIQLASDRTVTGLAPGSTARTVNGTSAGTETVTGTDASGAFTAVRSMGDTTKALVLPVPSNGSEHPYPASGTVIRSMTASVTHGGAAAATSTRREVVTYDGTATATLVITTDGVTKNCTIALPHGRPACQ